jgi:hypothetical protein
MAQANRACSLLESVTELLIVLGCLANGTERVIENEAHLRYQTGRERLLDAIRPQ